MGLAVPLLVAMALGAAYREARNSCRLATQGIALLLEMEKQKSRTRKTNHQFRDSGTDPQEEFGESALGSTADPWGAAQTRYRSLPSYSGEVWLVSENRPPRLGVLS